MIDFGVCVDEYIDDFGINIDLAGCKKEDIQYTRSLNIVYLLAKSNTDEIITKRIIVPNNVDFAFVVEDGLFSIKPIESSGK